GEAAAGEPSEVVAARVREARERARSRHGDLGVLSNAQLPGSWLRSATSASAARPAYAAVDRGALTARGLDRVLRVAWTIADLAGLAQPGEDEVLRAMALRTRGEPGAARARGARRGARPPSRATPQPPRAWARPARQGRPG